MVKDWRDLPDESTPILASELERMEQNTEDAANAAGAATSAVAGFAGRIGAAEDRVSAAEAGIFDLDATKAESQHTHQIADTTGLQGALDGKSPTGHKHPGSDITSGVVKTINLTGPDGAGNVSIPAVTSSNSPYSTLVGGPGGSWRSGHALGARISDGVEYACTPGPGNAGHTFNSAFRLLKSTDGYVYARPDASRLTIIQPDLGNVVNYQSGSTHYLGYLPVGVRPPGLVTLTNGNSGASPQLIAYDFRSSSSGSAYMYDQERVSGVQLQINSQGQIYITLGGFSYAAIGIRFTPTSMHYPLTPLWKV